MSPDTFLIDNAHIVPVAAEPFDGRLLVIGGVITALGPGIAVPEGIPIIDAGGWWLLPGLIDAHTHLGMEMQGLGVHDSDVNEFSLINAAGVRAMDAINPADDAFTDALSAGITTVCVMPGSLSPIGGQPVTLHTAGRSLDEMTIPARPSLKMAMGENPKREHIKRSELPLTRMGIAYTIRKALTAARARLDSADPGVPDLDLEPLIGLLRGEAFVRQHCHRADDILTALRLAREFGYTFAVEHGTEAYLVADILAEHDVSVVLGSFMDARPKVELRHKSTHGAGILDRAGVEFALSTDHPVLPIQHLILQAIVAVRDGLDRDRALEAITLTPARILGIDDRHGSLSVGKSADLALWTGDPFDIYQTVDRVWVAGRLAWETAPTT